MTNKQPKYWVGEVPLRSDFGDAILGEFIDGRTKEGPWAIMSPEDHRQHGVGIGQGKGQRYQIQGDGRWLKVEGQMLTKEGLGQFIGTEAWYKHWLVPGVTYTEGVRHVAVEGSAYWLIDEIVFAQDKKAVKSQEFQSWVLKVDKDKSAWLTCQDGDYHYVYRKKIEVTDFPLDEIKFFFTQGVIMLPSEY